MNQKKRPKGITIFLIVTIIEFVIMMALFPIYYLTPEVYSSNFSSDSGTISEFALLKFNDHFLVFNTLSVSIGMIVIIGLLSAKKLGRIAVIVGSLSILLLSLAMFLIPGLVLYGALTWYMFRAKTKEYFD